MILASFLIVVVAYLLGSIPTGYLLVRLFRKQDIRSVGSGNIGATNVLRSGGKGLGAATFLLDVLKGCAAVWVGGLLGELLLPEMPFRDAQAIAALAAVIGHMFPVWLHFRGGKGVATGFGVFLVAAPLAALAAITTFALILLISRYVSLASIIGAGELSCVCVVPRAWGQAGLLHRGAGGGCAVDHREASPEHSAGCWPAQRAASARMLEKGNLHEPNRRTGFRCVGNRNRSLPAPPSRPRGDALVP